MSNHDMPNPDHVNPIKVEVSMRITGFSSSTYWSGDWANVRQSVLKALDVTEAIDEIQKLSETVMLELRGSAKGNIMVARAQHEAKRESHD